MLENIFAILMALLMIGVGLFCGVNAVSLLYGNAKMWRAAARSKTWPSIEGQVAETTVKHTGRFSWTPIITHTFHANGVDYRGGPSHLRLFWQLLLARSQWNCWALPYSGSSKSLLWSQTTARKHVPTNSSRLDQRVGNSAVISISANGHVFVRWINWDSQSLEKVEFINYPERYSQDINVSLRALCARQSPGFQQR